MQFTDVSHKQRHYQTGLDMLFSYREAVTVNPERLNQSMLTTKQTITSKY